MIEPTQPQLSIINAPLESMSVLACAGSGKTYTAVKRLIRVRELLKQSKSHVALLSFSNVAINTFRKEYRIYSINYEHPNNNKRVTIDTFDSFITTNILRPHAYRTMGSNNSPFLITGAESFLQNKKFQFWYSSGGKDIPIQGNEIHNVIVHLEEEGVSFKYRNNNMLFEINNGDIVVKRLGELGAYTHELGKYWALLTLAEEPDILRILARRYSHIIIDEAQDMGALHQLLIETLQDEGVTITLIGDSNQAIYEFAGANGVFIRNFKHKLGVISFSLTENHRSIPDVLKVANSISKGNDKSKIITNNTNFGAFYNGYDPQNHRPLVDAFTNKLQTASLNTNNSAVLYRGRSGMEKLNVITKSLGQGKIKLLTLAAIARDVDSDYLNSFKLVVKCVVSLLSDTPDKFSSRIITPSSDSNDSSINSIRQFLWRFVRDNSIGLPSASLKANSEWHQLTKDRIINLLDHIEKEYGYKKVENLGNKLSKKGLTDAPLKPYSLDNKLDIRIDTVHQAKGESLDAVLYVARKDHIEAMLNGVDTELGRIGYVAVTRAKNLFVLGVPMNDLKILAPKLEAFGLKKMEV